MKTIGFIGLGTMGRPMAARLLKKGYPVTVYNRTKEKSEELLRLGAELASRPSEAASSADVLITMLSGDEAILNVFYGNDGILHGVHPGMTVIDCTTVSPGTSRQLHVLLEEHYVNFLDAPVVGGIPEAENGSLVFMAGGLREVFDAHADLFQAMGSKALYMGPSGSGSCTKLAHNTMLGIHAAALAEALAISTKAGVDPVKFLEIVHSGDASSRLAETKGQRIVQRDFSRQFPLSSMMRDLGLSSQLTRQFQLPTPMLNAATTLFQIGIAKGLGELDFSALVQCYEEWMQQQVVPLSDERRQQPRSPLSARRVERRKSVRIPMNIRLHLSVYQWENGDSFSGEHLEGTLVDLSDSGLQIVTRHELTTDMFVVVHFPQEANLPPITGKIIRIVRKNDLYHYGCMLSGLPPYTRIRLEEYIKEHLQKTEAGKSYEEPS